MKIPLTAGAYQARSILADAQQCVNLFMEKNPPDSPFPYTSYPTPGLQYKSVAPVTGPVRALYLASTGTLYAVVSSFVYTISSSFVWTNIGTISTSSGYVSMKDNTLALVIVDGSTSGYAVKLSDNSFGAISSTNFYGSTRVDYLDTYLIFNRPNTNQFYFSLSNVTYENLTGGTAFDPLDIAAKTGGNDRIVACAVMHREIWLIGQRTSEVWFNSGQADFTFQSMPGSFVEHGCSAAGSIAQYDLALYWLGQDNSGNSIVFEGSQYRCTRISTYAIENEIATYQQKSAAIGFTYLQEGHIFYVLTFPAEQKTWVYDVGEKLWHRRAWSDEEGNLYRWRPNCFAPFGNYLMVGDYQNGNVYNLDLNYYLDNGAPIIRTQSFPHITEENDRLMHRNIIAAMEVGNKMDDATDDQFKVSLRYSDNAGRSYNEAVLQTLGNTGQYQTSMQWNRLGLARDRVYELSWSAPIKTALQGVYLEATKAGS